MILKLNNEWELGATIGAGGFGRVYEARSFTNGNAAVKLVPKAKGANRESLFVSLTGIRNVIPIIDSGETTDSWALVMPRAEKSLLEFIQDAGSNLTAEKVIPILANVGTALADMDGKIVHRDLKPANILLLGGEWCLADFGIARYAEATTSADTLKHAMSAAYAAPERWRSERATIAADIYSLGVIAYQLLTGSIPFVGPDSEEYRDQHLHATPGEITAAPPLLAALITECLFKPPGSRPTPANFITRLVKIGQAKRSGGLAKLQNVNRDAVARQSREEMEKSKNRTESENAKDLAIVAATSLKAISASVKDTIVEAAPSVKVKVGRDAEWELRLKEATLRFGLAIVTPLNPWGKWQPPAFKVIASAAVGISIPRNQYGYEGRSHSLWYCDAMEAGRFSWFETAFMISPLIAKQVPVNPFALPPGENAAKCFWRGMAEYQLAWPMYPLRIDDLDEFIERWANWYADAAEGRLNYPSAMPERSPDRKWRES